MSTMPVVRKVNFQVNSDTLPKYYMKGNPIATHLANSFHIIFPEGERFFIRSVKKFTDRIQDAGLKERVKAFIGQEIQHGGAHEKLWSTLQEQGVDVEGYKEFFYKAAFGFLEEYGRKWFGEEMTLSVTVALEHYTAIMAEAAFERNGELFKDLPEEMRNLMLWHAAEEIEHKSVAFDVLKEVDDSYALRIGGMVIATLGLAFFGTAGQISFLANDEDFKAMSLADKFRYLQKFLENQSRTFRGNLLKYFRPDFHPDQQPEPEAARQFLREFKNEKSNQVA